MAAEALWQKLPPSSCIAYTSKKENQTEGRSPNPNPAFSVVLLWSTGPQLWPPHVGSAGISAPGKCANMQPHIFTARKWRAPAGPARPRHMGGWRALEKAEKNYAQKKKHKSTEKKHS